jgi:hypothetical protein
MLSLCLMPVDYRAGAEQAHPHAILEILIDTLPGRPIHHHERHVQAASPTVFTSGLANEHRDIADGQFTINIGFINEPAFVNQQNGLYLRIETESAEQPSAGGTPAAEGVEGEHNEGVGIIGLAETLQAEEILGDQTMALPLSPGTTPGEYHSVFFPTAVGDYTFHIWGELVITAIDDVVTAVRDPTTWTNEHPALNSRIGKGVHDVHRSPRARATQPDRVGHHGSRVCRTGTARLGPDRPHVGLLPCS